MIQYSIRQPGPIAFRAACQPSSALRGCIGERYIQDIDQILHLEGLKFLNNCNDSGALSDACKWRRQAVELGHHSFPRHRVCVESLVVVLVDTGVSLPSFSSISMRHGISVGKWALIAASGRMLTSARGPAHLSSQCAPGHTAPELLHHQSGLPRSYKANYGQLLPWSAHASLLHRCRRR